MESAVEFVSNIHSAYDLINAANKVGYRFGDEGYMVFNNSTDFDNIMNHIAYAKSNDMTWSEMRDFLHSVYLNMNFIHSGYFFIENNRLKIITDGTYKDYIEYLLDFVLKNNIMVYCDNEDDISQSVDDLIEDGGYDTNG